MTNRLFLILGAATLLALAGCQSQKPAASTAPPPVQLVAYINVSSGCQAATVDFIKSLQQKYPRLQVELVDFGDGGAGLDRWQNSGHKCMTLEINGQPVVKFPVESKEKAISFRMPAGFLWNHEDLEQAVAAAMQGTLQPATDDEALGDISPEQMKAKEDALQKSKASKSGGKTK